MTRTTTFTLLAGVLTLYFAGMDARPTKGQATLVQQPGSVSVDAVRTTEETPPEIGVWSKVLDDATGLDAIGITIQASHGSMQGPKHETWEYTPDPGYHGTDTIGTAESDAAEVDTTTALTADDTTHVRKEADTTESAEQPLAEEGPPESGALGIDTTQADTAVASAEADTSKAEPARDTTAKVDNSQADTTQTDTLKTPQAAPDTIEYAYEVGEGDTLQVSEGEGLRRENQVARIDTSTVHGPTYGRLMASPDGSFTYLPDSTFSGTDRFMLATSDTLGNARVASVTIVVHPRRSPWLYGSVVMALLAVGTGLFLFLFRSSESGSRHGNERFVEEPRVRVQLGHGQHIGARDYQEDALDFTDPDTEETLARAGMLAIVADGMGGLERGYEASRRAIRTFRSEYEAKASQEDVPQALRRALDEANRTVCALSPSDDGRVGSTLIAVVVHDEALYWIAVGDSRIYLLRNGQLAQLNEDHVYARDLAESVARGEIRPADADEDPERHALTSYVGSDLEAIDQNIRPFPLQPDDRLLLCSDGLYDTLQDSAMADILQDYDPQAACDRLIHEVLTEDMPHQDNLTAVVLKYQTVHDI